MALTPATAVEELVGQQSLQGLDLEEPEALRLLNEADTDMCVRSEHSRATVELGPTVADQEAYDIPATVYRVLSLTIEGTLYKGHIGEDDLTRLEMQELYLRHGPVWTVVHNSAGVEQIAPFPVPDEAGLPILGKCVVYPEEFDIDGEFNVPPDFRRGLLNYVRHVSLGASEDDTDREGVYSSAYESEVQRLARRRRMRTGHGTVTMRVRGVTA